MSQDLNPSTCSSLVIFMYRACESQGSIFVVLQTKSSSGKCAKLHTVAAINNRDYLTRSLCYCLFAPHILVLLFVHILFVMNRTFKAMPTERLQQHPPLFYNKPHLSYVLFVNVAPATTFTSWSQHHFVVIGKPERQVRKASHCGSKERY